MVALAEGLAVNWAWPVRVGLPAARPSRVPHEEDCPDPSPACLDQPACAGVGTSHFSMPVTNVQLSSFEEAFSAIPSRALSAT